MVKNRFFYFLLSDRFDFAFRKYTSAWAFRHPTPYDFFHAINNAAGENLEWFWKSWFFSTATLDQAITEVKINGDSTLITVENKGGLIMPVTAKMYERNGDSAVVKLPIEIWQRTSSWTFRFIAKSPVQRIVLDPEQLLPDADRMNSEWAAGKK
jgi:aminopeptidase N